MSTIHSLPDKLLVYIFRDVQPNSARDILLTHVCVRWRAILINAPEFWVDILATPNVITYSDRMHEDYTLWHTFVNRTQPRSFSLSLQWKDVNLLDTIPLHLSRIASLSLSYDGRCPDDIIKVYRLGMPTLVSLRCASKTSYKSFSIPEYQDDLSERFPRLCQLEIFGTFTPKIALRTFTSMTIAHGYLTFADLLSGLTNCPLLEYLNLQHLTARDRPPYATDVYLPRLRQWTMRDEGTNSDWVYAMFRHISCAPATRVSVQCQAELRNHRLLASVRRVPVVPHEAVGEAGDAKRISLQLKDAKWDERTGPTGESQILCDLFDAIAVAPLTDLEMFFDPSCVEVRQVDWERVFVSSPGIVSLAVVVNSCSTLLEALAHEAELRLPILESLDVTYSDGEDVHALLVSTIERRASRGLALKRLKLWCFTDDAPMSESYLARLQALVTDDGI
ncbi:hypothetical protein C8Q74DRAFT_1370980 [Fomes fomentarius]|nr:hypothetical protein C8Q74DRAFT_1370980 [Fomes fomentarius]